MMKTEVTQPKLKIDPAILLTDTGKAVVYRAVSTLAEREMCFRLVHDSYVRLGYMKPNWGGIRFNEYLTTDGTVTFGAFEDDVLMSTMTLIMDSSEGLPCEQLFRDEVVLLRKSGRKVAEVGALASVDCGQRGGLERFLTLARMCGKYAFEQGVHDALITVNPRHRDIYPKLLKFEKLSEPRSYSFVESNPAICYRIRREIFPTAPWVEGVTIPDVPLQAPHFNAADKEYFSVLSAGGVLMGTA